MEMKRFLFFIPIIIGIVFALSTQFAIAQLPTLRSGVDKRQILIGEQLTFQVEATFPSNAYQIIWFNVPDSFSHFEVVTRGKIVNSENRGTTTRRQTFILTSFDSGIYSIPGLPISFDSLSGNKSINVFTDSIPINISFSPQDSSKTFHDIKTIIEVKDEIPLWMWISGIVLLILLIVFIIYLVKHFKSRKKPEVLFNSKLTPFDEAMQSLVLLQNEQLLSKGAVKLYHTRLTDTFKRYLSRKTQKNILNFTSSDILVLLNDTLLTKSDTSLVAGSLRMTDAVKFAKYLPPASESEAAFIHTKQVIEQIEKLIFTD
jgi:heme/copper-type cytochrome/quinol oxidase subunit 2